MNIFLGAKAQDTIVPKEIIVPKVSKRLTRDPQSLSQALIEGKSTEKEKFDAIFGWVVHHIRYNDKQYKSGKANSSNVPIQKTLRERKAICLDFAHLMDTLCDFAGIQNTTITGYIKDITFDVNDSLYFDTHAWNAVKLNGLWYLYDVTWSYGRKEYEYTRFSKWRLKIRQKQLEKMETVELSLNIERKKENEFCEIPEVTVLKTLNIKQLPLLPHVIVWILDLLPYKIREVQKKVLNFDYYLAQPEVFAFNHFPNDPQWSLGLNLRNASEFSADSAYYYRNGNDYDQQIRTGTFCVHCDDVLYMEPIPKEKKIIETSKANNLNNHIVPANGNLNIAFLFFEQALKAEDSLVKMNLVDSTLFYINESKLEFRKSKGANSVNTRFHNNKNRTKKNLLVKENKAHWVKANKAFKETIRRAIKMNSLTSKAKEYNRKNRMDLRDIDRELKRNLSSKTLSEVRIEALKKKLMTANRTADSITQEIVLLQDKVFKDFTLLWQNVLEELDVLDPLVNDFRYDTHLRAFYAMDHYDRLIRERRKEIAIHEELFLSSFQQNVLQLSDTCYAEFIRMNRLIKKRNSIFKSAAKTISSLRSSGLVSEKEIIDYQTEITKTVKKDACWNVNNIQLIEANEANFKIFYKQNKAFYKAVSHNEAVERSRYKRVSKEIERNKKRVNHAVELNTRQLSKLKKALLAHRKDFLKELRKNSGV